MAAEEGTAMKWLLCRLFGHQKVRRAFSNDRFVCRRCGLDL
jgi:hypothetical protein